MYALDYVVLAGYFLTLAVIGVVCMYRVRGQEDFFMGGRSFGKLLQTFAAFGAGTGANDPIQVGRTTWTSGLSGIWSVLMWLFVTPFYWIFGVWYRRMRHVTLGDFFVERYDSKGLGAAYTVFGIVFYMMYLSTMFSAISKFAAPLIGVAAISLPGISSPMPLEFILVPAVAAVVMLYGILGGLRAAYWTDLIQGTCIIVLSIILIPSGLSQLVERYGDADSDSWFDGFAIMHDRVPADYFNIFSGPRAGEFPLQYIVSLSLLALIGIVVQPHFIATGGGTARNEFSARVGLVTGNFLKRLCTVGWALTALIVLALMANSPVIAQDPDYVWGVAARELLGPLNLGLAGLMLACLLAALMSSADCYMLVGSALMVRNIYAAYIDPNASEKAYVTVGRAAGTLVVIGASVISLYFWDVFAQFKMAMEVPVVFAAPFWIGMFWRRTGKWAVWLTVVFSTSAFFVVPALLPIFVDGLRSDSDYLISNRVIVTTVRRTATISDVEKRAAWEDAREEIMRIENEAIQKARLAALPPEPPVASVGQTIDDVYQTGGASIYWRDGLKALGEVELVEVDRRTEGNREIVTYRREGEFEGQGSFNLDFLLYGWLGMDLTSKSSATLETLRLPPRLVTPFLVLMMLSLITPSTRGESLDRFYAKMKTPVHPDRDVDQKRLDEAYANPRLLDAKKLFPNSSWEFQRPTFTDVFGFILCFGICFAIIGLAVLLVNIGSG